MSSFSVTWVMIYEDIVISWLQHAVVWRFVAKNVWWVLGRDCNPGIPGFPNRDSRDSRDFGINKIYLFNGLFSTS